MGRIFRLFRLAAWLSCLAFSLSALPAQAQLVLPTSFSLSPSSATGGGTISVGASRLPDGRYEVFLLQGRTPITLVDIASGTGEFQRYVKLPALAAGTYTVELHVGGQLHESRSYRILSPLTITTSTSSPKAGSSLAFTVSGLTRGSLSLLYAGKPAFGPVNVETGSYSGKFVVPTDRPASLPASVALSARNAVGKTVPRVGSRTLSVQPADRNPLVRLTSSTPTSSSVTSRQTFNITGSLATNELDPTETDVQYWWRSADGSVVPMGTQRAIVGADGSFSATMRAPSLGTLSAAQAVGAGSVFGVGKGRDKYGQVQHESGLSASPLNSILDTDAAIDVSLVLTGSDGKRIEGARVVLSSAQLDELYPPNSNSAPIRMDGGLPGVPTQYSPPVANDELAGCPDDLERQTSNANGQASFEFGVDVPQGGMSVSGDGPAPVLTIQPTQDCQNIPSNPGDTAQRCTLVDPAGIHATLTVISAHTGYGWLRKPLGPNDGEPEVSLTVGVRVDRYTGQVTTRTCPPDTDLSDNLVPPCNERSFDRSANLSLVLPLLQTAGLLLNDPTWTQGANASWPRVAARDNLTLDYEYMPDLSAFENKATFSPSTPQARTFQVGYVRGAGNTLASATLKIPGVLELPLNKVGGTDSCDISATEVWSAPVPASFLQKLRYPGKHWNNNPLVGWVKATEQGTNRTGLRYFRFNFAGTPPATAGLATRPGIAIDVTQPHWARVTLPPQTPNAATSTGDGNTAGCDDTGDTDCDAIGELKSKSNEAEASLDQQFCLPVGETRCGALSHADSVQQIHSRQSENPPAGASFGGGGAPPDLTEQPWKTLFDKTIPLFRWYWGVPELLSAEVFADLALKAEYLLNYVLKPLQPLQSYVETGGRLDVSIMIGVDVDVLFGILVDAGAAITGYLNGEVVARAEASAPTSPCIDQRLNFGMYFSYWVEIGCPFPNPFDPTCYIPDIEGSHTIFDEQVLDGSSCLANKAGAPGGWKGLEASLAALGTGKGTLPPIGPVMAVSPEQRRSLNRHTAISIDGAGNKLMLFLDREWGDLVASDVPVEGAPSRAVLRKAYGLRDVAVMHYGTDRAVAVWAQSDLLGPPAAGVDLASRQHLVWAAFDGDTWSTPKRLTSPGFGEGGVRLARCKPNPLRYRSDCVSDKVSVVFQRNTTRKMGGESHIYLSRFDGDSWTTPVRVDQSGTHNITPAVAYQNAQPVVAWVRYAPNAALTTDAQRLSSVDDRNLALRVMDGAGNEEVETRITRAAQPDIATTSSGRLALAYTRAASADAFVGTRQALFLGERTCINEGCSLRTFAVRDAHGRLIYGERPRIAPNASGGIGVVFRALSLGAIAGAASPESNLLPGDPAGILTTRGELLNITSNLSASQTVVQNLSNDAGGHFQASVAFDPVSQEMVAISGVLPAGLFKRNEQDSARLLAKVESVDEGVQLAALPDLPDLAVETLASPATQLTPGGNIAVSIGLINGGSAWTPDDTRSATLRLYWDTPETRETIYGNVAVAALAPGARRQVDLQIPVPAAFSNDERQTLRAELMIEDDDGELDGANNAATLALGGLPVPSGLQAFSVPGSRIVNLTWDDPQDPRVAGYRIWVEDADGTPQPMGSSFNAGFADVSALFGFSRTYRVSTYSSRGVESELSQPLQAEPSLAVLGESLGTSVFRNGFE
jgi:hypothetical protein